MSHTLRLQCSGGGECLQSRRSDLGPLVLLPGLLRLVDQGGLLFPIGGLRRLQRLLRGVQAILVVAQVSAGLSLGTRGTCGEQGGC